MEENLLKAAVRENRVAVGTVLGTFATREMPHVLQYANLDWVMIDMEHSAYTLDQVADAIGWFKATRITVIVRPPDNLPHLLSRVMDAGASGVVVARVDTADDARRAVRAVMYPPLGDRGIGLNALHTNYARPNAAAYMAAANARTSVIAMIESPKGVENAGEIAAVEGVDFIQPTHYDLSYSLGCPDDFQHPAYKDAVAKIAAACRRHGKGMSYNPRTDADVAEFYALGCRVMGVQEPVAAMQEAMKKNASHLRETVARLGR